MHSADRKALYTGKKAMGIIYTGKKERENNIQSS